MRDILPHWIVRNVGLPDFRGHRRFGRFGSAPAAAPRSTLKAAVGQVETFAEGAPTSEAEGEAEAIGR